MLTNHDRSLDAATPIQFRMSSGKKQKYYACSGSVKQHGNSHYNAICRDCAAKHKRASHNAVKFCCSSTAICNDCLANQITTALAKSAIHNMDAAITMRSARLSCTLQWRTRGGRVRAQNEQAPTRRTDELPFIVAGSHLVRENVGFPANPSPKTSR